MGHGRLLSAALTALIVFASSARAAVTTDIVKVNFARLIRQSISHPNRFAADVPHRITSGANGAWTRSNGQAVWRYNVQIPTAISISFHADGISLPSSGRLSVIAGSARYIYTSKDIDRGQLWSRVAKGNELRFELTVPLKDQSQVLLRISNFQAGYRSLERGGQNHPLYESIRRMVRGTSSSSCVQNYECNADSANQGPAQATVAILIANIGQCSGTLLNDAPADGTAYVLTARHCENDTLGGGAPQNAANTTIYWDATTPCGQVLGTIYDPGIPEQAGAETVVEQQDAWLLRLDTTPVVGDAYYAGWDTSGTPITGGYTIDQAFSNSKQYAEWYGQSLLLTIPGKQLENLAYTSTFWSVVNQLGSVGPGASGSGLFDSSGQLVGSLSLGVEQGDSGICPAAPLVAPNGSNGAADFTALSGVYSSVADTSSTTGSVTIQSVLDPQHTGIVAQTGLAGLAPIAFKSSSSSPAAGTAVKLSWSAPNAGACAASGGNAGDGWSGALAASGSVSVIETNQGIVTYSITCAVSPQQLSSQVTVNWGSANPTVDMSLSPASQWINGPITVQWGGDVSPCTLSGAINQSNLPSSGTATVTETTAGTYQVAISCGSGSAAAHSQESLIFTNPEISINGYAERLVNEGFLLEFESAAQRCVPSGGGNDPIWVNSVFNGNGAVWIYEPVAGTYTYSLTCYSGTESAQTSTTVAIQSGPASVTLTANASSVPYGNPITLNWVTNVDNCVASEPTPNPSDQWSEAVGDAGPFVIQEPVVGTHTYVINCGTPYTGFGTAESQATVTITPSKTSATLSSSEADVAPGQSFTLTWNSTNAFICTGTGAVTDTQWNTQNGPSGSLTISEAAAGTYTYTITCSTGTQSGAAQTTVKVAPLTTGGGSTGTTSTGSGSGGGGGGAADQETLISLVALLLMRLRRFGRFGQPLIADTRRTERRQTE